MPSKLLVSCGETSAGTRPRLGLKPGPPEWKLHSMLATPVPRPWARTADVLTRLAASAELFHTADGTAFADFMVDAHRETWPVRSSRMRSWLRRKYYEDSGAAAGSVAINSALDLLEARAQFEAPQRAIHLRVAEHDGRIYLDLADEQWRAIDIGPDGWQVVTRPPVRFRRAAGMLPLPMPMRGGSLEALTSVFNLASRNDFILVLAWLLAGFRQGGPYPLLAVSGEQGSAKTVFSKILRALIVPNAAPVRTAPREERDLFIAASNGHLLAYNLSDLPPWMSDSLCRLASGGNFAVRQLYTDRDEVLFQAARPIILNSIEDVITRPDLADRAIFLSLPHLQEGRRRGEKQIWRDFEMAQPRILGALLDAASHGLRALPEVRLEQLRRMADFALWATACEPAFCPAGGFLHAYKANRQSAIEEVVDADAVAARIRDVMAGRVMWSGNATELLRVAAPDPSDKAPWTSVGWPKSPRALAGRLRRAQTPLRALGIEINFGREGRTGTRIIRMRKSYPAATAATVSTVSADAPKKTLI
jgi:hypothetical protein